jgi:hypothetical protein
MWRARLGPRVGALAVAVAFLGTSRPLAWRSLDGKIAAPEGGASLGTARAYWGESSNNQACLRRDRLDLIVAGKLQDSTPRSLEPGGGEVQLLGAGGAPVLERPVAPQAIQLAQGGQLRIELRDLTSLDAFEQVQAIRLRLPASGGPVAISFDGVGASPIRRDGTTPASWSP